LFDQCVDLGVKLGSHISLHLAKETGSIGDGYIVPTAWDKCRGMVRNGGYEEVKSIAYPTSPHKK